MFDDVSRCFKIQGFKTVNPDFGISSFPFLELSLLYHAGPCSTPKRFDLLSPSRPISPEAE